MELASFVLFGASFACSFHDYFNCEHKNTIYLLKSKLKLTFVKK
jgi:hypothetical protein